MSQGASRTSQQYKCDVCGQIFSSQSDLDDHYKSVHTMRTAMQDQSASGMSSTSASSAARWAGQGVSYHEEAGTDASTERKKDASVTSGEGSSRTWKEATKEEMKTMETPRVETSGNTGSSSRDMSRTYSEGPGRGGETAVRGEDQLQQGSAQNQASMQSQYKCQRCGQVFASQNDLTRHNKNIHGIDTESDMSRRA